MCYSEEFFGGFFGAKLLQKLDDKYLKLFFIGFLIYVGIKLIVQA